MKLVKSAAILLLSMATTFISAQDKVVPYSQIPSGIKSFITTHFPKHSVAQSEIDTEGLGFSKQYEINLNDGTELKFNNKNQIIAIEGKSKLPESVIPEKIRKYIATNYPNNAITDWEIDGKNQQISLDNDLELEFNKNGDFVKIDN
ncbi:MAG: PepSY-like domain-containing protein [Bacteroidales bacterium]|nr:PepSY-like domain-containing protein [Bacteroidales bacterium]